MSRGYASLTQNVDYGGVAEAARFQPMRSVTLYLETRMVGDVSGLAECAFPHMIPLAGSLPVWTQSRGTACFLSWVQAINTVLPAKPIAIDGKTARRCPFCWGNWNWLAAS